MRAEDRLQASIFTYLCTVAPQCFVFAVPNGGYRTKAEAAILKATGVVAGVPDLIVLAPSRILVGLEVKVPKTGRLSAAQTEVSEHWRALGHTWAVVRSIDDVRRTLASVGVVTREAA